jgi:putative oxidoreductase
MVALFHAIGAGQWLRLLTGILERCGAVLIVAPKSRTTGAAPLAGVMVGAVVGHLFGLHLSAAGPGVLLLLSARVVSSLTRETRRRRVPLSAG